MVRKSVDVAEHRRVGLLRDRVPQPQDGHAVADSAISPPTARITATSSSVYSNGVPLQVAPVQLADHLAFGAEWRLRPLHSGHLAARKADAEPRSALRTLQCGGGRADGARRPVRGESATSTGFPTCRISSTGCRAFGAAYDLTGNGKTALKFSVGRYMEQDASAFPERYNPMTLVPSSVSWIDLNTQLQDCKLPAVDKTGCNDIAEGELGCTYPDGRMRDEFRAAAGDLWRPPQPEPRSRPGAALSARLQRRHLARASARARHLRQLLPPAVLRHHVHDGSRQAVQRLYPVRDSTIRAATAR